MDAEEREIYYFLKPWKHEFISSREICRRAGGKRKYQSEPDWARPHLTRMTERGILETDSADNYRILPPKDKGGMKRWVSPQIAAILKSKSTGSDTIVMSEQDLDDYYDKL